MAVSFSNPRIVINDENDKTSHDAECSGGTFEIKLTIEVTFPPGSNGPDPVYFAVVLDNGTKIWADSKKVSRNQNQNPQDVSMTVTAECVDNDDANDENCDIKFPRWSLDGSTPNSRIDSPSATIHGEFAASRSNWGNNTQSHTITCTCEDEKYKIQEQQQNRPE